MCSDGQSVMREECLDEPEKLLIRMWGPEFVGPVRLKSLDTPIFDPAV